MLALILFSLLEDNGTVVQPPPSGEGEARQIMRPKDLPAPGGNNYITELFLLLLSILDKLGVVGGDLEDVESGFVESERMDSGLPTSMAGSEH